MLLHWMQDQNTAILHIGLPKTGTTSIQAFLWMNRDNLEAAGVRYPSFLKRRNHIPLAVYAIGERRAHLANVLGIADVAEWRQWRSKFRSRFISETSQPGTWVFSSEHMASRLLGVDRVEELQMLLAETFDSVRVVLYVRRQDDMVVSSYSTWIRDGRTEPFDLNANLQNSNRYDFRKVILRWEEVFGRSAVSVRLYPGHHADRSLIDDFANVLGLANIEDWPRPERLNRSLSAAEIEFLRRFNAHIRRLDDNLAQIPDMADPAPLIEGAIGGPSWRLGAHDSRMIMEHYAYANEWTLERVDNYEPDPDYFSPFLPAPAGGTDELTITADQAIAVAAKLWDTMEVTESER
jgi:hypothetical protein